MKPTTNTLIISLLFILSGIFLNYSLIQSSYQYKKAKEALAQRLSYKTRFLDKEEWQQIDMPDGNKFSFDDAQMSITLPFRSSDSQKAAYDEQKASISEFQTTIYTKSLLVLLTIGLYIVLMVGLYLWKKPPLVGLITVIAVSIVCLHAGLFTPMLEIGAIERDLNLGDIPIQKEIMGYMVNITVEKQFEGDIYFYYQSKSIAELIGLLFKQSNFVVGICILLFSVCFPIIKTLLMILFVFKPSIAKEKWFSNFVLNLSKWSMADVFVVAMFLGFLAFENMQAGVHTYSNISIGLYFFLAYCILSISSSMLVKQPTKELA